MRIELEKATKLDRIRADYNVHYWSQGFYGIDDQGEVYVSPRSDRAHQIPFSAIVNELEAQQLNLPVLVRFPQSCTNVCMEFATLSTKQLKNTNIQTNTCWCTQLK